MSNIKADVYSKDKEIWLKNIPKFAKDANYLRKCLMLYIKRTKKTKGLAGLGELKPQVDSITELANTYLRLGTMMLKSGIGTKQERDIAQELSNENE